MITTEPLTESMQRLVDEGNDVTLSALANCAFGSLGYDVQALVRMGHWREKEYHIGHDRASDWWRYGPKP